jgi:hypothetical protein
MPSSVGELEDEDEEEEEEEEEEDEECDEDEDDEPGEVDEDDDEEQDGGKTEGDALSTSSVDRGSCRPWKCRGEECKPCKALCMLDIIVAVSISIEEEEEEEEGGGAGGLEGTGMSTTSVFSSRPPPTPLTVVV